ncbi:ester cyclase [Arthrobacter mobilis]|uniref:ester cyclase n=1 Tax=Arthrobacter mobilis TaxID=2724944 RepID=UPI002483CB35|nr:ester cyclase [Arthrobacter mobilis]
MAAGVPDRRPGCKNQHPDHDRGGRLGRDRTRRQVYPYRAAAHPAGEIPPTGRHIELQIAEVYQFKDGKISLLRAYYDLATLMRQLGLGPEAP